MKARKAAGGLSSHRPLNAGDIQPPSINGASNFFLPSLSVRKPIDAATHQVHQQIALPGLAPRRPLDATGGPPARPRPTPDAVAMVPQQQIAIRGLAPRRPMEAKVDRQPPQQRSTRGLHARKPLQTANNIDDDDDDLVEPMGFDDDRAAQQDRQAQIVPNLSMCNRIMPTVRSRKGIDASSVNQQPQKQKQKQQQQQFPLLRGLKLHQLNDMVHHLSAHRALDASAIVSADPSPPAHRNRIPAGRQRQSAPHKFVRPSELEQLQAVYELGYIQLEEFRARAAEVRTRQSALASGDTAAALYSPYVGAVDVDARAKPEDFVPPFLMGTGEPLSVDHFVSSSYSLEICGDGPLNIVEPTTRSANVKMQTAENRSVRVFISSTFRDMTEERELLLKHVFPKLRKFCNDRGVFLTQVDLRWGITSDQSSAGNTISICLKEVDRCRPYFVCMLGERYGWAQPDEEKSDDLLKRTFDKATEEFPWVSRYSDRSVTELEIRHALLNHVTDEALEHSVFCYRDPAYYPADPQDLKFKHKLDALKHEIRLAGATVSDYRIPKEAAEYILNSVEKMLEKDFPLKEMPSPLEKERNAHAAFAATRSRVYIGRQHYFDEINDHLHDLRCKPLVIVGESGSGKSALTCNWTVQYKAKHPHRLIVDHYIGSNAESTDLGRLLLRVMSEIKEHFGLARELPRDLKEMKDSFSDWLGEASQRGGMVLVLDALNQLEDKGDVHDLRWLPMEFPNNVQLVASTLPGRCLRAIESRQWKKLVVHPLNEAERTSLVKEYLSQYSKTLTDSQTKKIVQAYQCNNPLFLRTLLEEIRVFGVYERLDAHIDRYLSARDPPGLFDIVLTRLETDFAGPDRYAGTFDARTMVGDIMALLWVSRRGLAESELLDVLEIPPSVWSPLHIALEEALVNRSGLFTFFHDYLKQAVETRYLRNGSRYNYYRTMLVDYFDGESSKDVLETRKCEEVPYQLLLKGSYSALAECITDLDMFSLLHHEERRFDLYKYWQEAAKHVPDMEQKIASKLSAFENETLSQVSRQNLRLLADKYGEVGKFLQDIAAYETAERMLARSLEIMEDLLGKKVNHPDIAQKLEGLAYLYRMRGKYTLAAPLYERALRIREKVQGPDNAEFASTVNSLAILYRHQGKYDLAEPLYKRALEIRQKLFGHTHADVAQSLNSLGCLNQDMGRYKESQDFFLRAVAMREALCGPNHPDVAMSLNNLAGLYLDQSRYEEARAPYNRSLSIYESVFGPAHPSVAQTLNSLAALAQEEGKFEEAAKLYERTLSIKEKMLGKVHPELALTLNDYAVLYARQDRYEEAEPLYLRALDIRRQVIGERHPDYAQSLNNLGSLYQDMKRYDDALPLFQQALAICESAFGPIHMDVGSTLTNIAGLYQFLGRYEEAVPLYQRALDIYKELLGENHADVAVALNDLAVLHFRQGNHARAEELYTRALDTYEKIFGAVHPDVGQALVNLGEFYIAQGRPDDALARLERAHSIYCKVLGPDHARTQRVGARMAGLV